MIDLLRKKVKIQDPSILQFFYPQFAITSSLEEEVEFSKGVIYTGLVTAKVMQKLELLTKGKFIIVSNFPDIALLEPGDFIKVCFPALEEKADRFNLYSMEQFLPILKNSYILNKAPVFPKDDSKGIYSLYQALVMAKTKAYETYFKLLEDIPAKVIASSLLTFFIKIRDEAYANKSETYKKLINSANLKFSDRIKPAVKKFSESPKSIELALWDLIDSL